MYQSRSSHSHLLAYRGSNVAASTQGHRPPNIHPYTSASLSIAPTTSSSSASSSSTYKSPLPQHHQHQHPFLHDYSSASSIDGIHSTRASGVSKSYMVNGNTSSALSDTAYLDTVKHPSHPSLTHQSRPYITKNQQLDGQHENHGVNDSLHVSSLYQSPISIASTVKRPLSRSEQLYARQPATAAALPENSNLHHNANDAPLNDSNVEIDRQLFASDIAARRASLQQSQLQVHHEHQSQAQQRSSSTHSHSHSAGQSPQPYSSAAASGSNPSSSAAAPAALNDTTQSIRRSLQNYASHQPIRATPIRHAHHHGALSDSIVHSPIEQNLRHIIQEKERELARLHEYREKQHHDEVSKQEIESVGRLQNELNQSLLLSADKENRLLQLQQQVVELSRWKQDKILHIDELERRIQHMHQLIAEKDKETIQHTHELHRMQQKCDKRIEKIGREHAALIEQLRNEFQQRQVQLDEQRRQEEQNQLAKQEELRQVLQSSEQAFQERKRVFAEKETELQAQLASYAQNALAMERELSLLRQSKNEQQSQLSELKLFANELESAYNEIKHTLDSERSEFSKTVSSLQHQLESISKERETLLNNYEQKVSDLVHQLQSVESEIAAINAQHAREMELAINQAENSHAQQMDAVQHANEDKLRALEQQLHTLEDELRNASNERNALQKQRDELNAHHSVELQQAHDATSSAQQRVSDLESKYNAALEKIQSLQQSMIERETELSQQTAEALQSKSREKELNKRLAELREASKREIEQVNNNWQTRYHDSTERIKRLERELHDKGLALQAEQSRTSELTALVTTLRSVTAETARLKTMEQQQMLNDFTGNISTVKSELHRISSNNSDNIVDVNTNKSPRPPSNTNTQPQPQQPTASPSSNTSTATSGYNAAQSAGSKTVRMKAISPQEIEKMREAGQITQRSVTNSGLVLVSQAPHTSRSQAPQTSR